MSKHHSSQGHRQRIKSRFLSCDFQGWRDYEIVEALLMFAIPQRDTKPMAKSLLAQFQSLSGVLNADIHDLQKITGIGSHAAILIKMVRATTQEYFRTTMRERNYLHSPWDVMRYLQTLFDSCHEEVLVAVYCDASHAPIFEEILQKGTVDRAAIVPRQVAQNALKHHAVSLLLAHNHPGGFVEPSEEDDHATMAVQKACDAIDVVLLDHVIVSGDQSFSYLEHRRSPFSYDEHCVDI